MAYNTEAREVCTTRSALKNGFESRSISATLALTLRDSQHQVIDGGAADRDVTLPTSAELVNGDWFSIRNAGATNALVVKDSAGTTVRSVAAAACAKVGWTGSAWIVLFHS